MTRRRIETTPGQSGEDHPFEEVVVRNLAALLVAKSLLGREGIQFFVKNEAHYLMSPYPTDHPVIMIPKVSAQRARKLLEQFGPVRE